MEYSGSAFNMIKLFLNIPKILIINSHFHLFLTSKNNSKGIKCSSKGIMMNKYVETHVFVLFFSILDTKLYSFLPDLPSNMPPSICLQNRLP